MRSRWARLLPGRQPLVRAVLLTTMVVMASCPEQTPCDSQRGACELKCAPDKPWINECSSNGQGDIFAVCLCTIVGVIDESAPY